MKRFAYGRDPLFLLGCALYALNRWWMKPRMHIAFLHDHFNDLWLIPCALPLLLLFQRRLGLRDHDRPPTWGEIAFHLVVWSILFEWAGPHIIRWTTGDPWDAAAYCIGGVLAGCWWNRSALIRPVQADEL